MISLEGRVLDRYPLRRVIGRGGMADVYLGYDPKFDREVAVKIFQREDNDLLRRFLQEARLMGSLHHSHLMPVYDTGEISMDGSVRYYIVMPYLGGGTLKQRIRRTPPAVETVCSYLQEIAEALDYIHARGIVHRDIKSSNVLLDNDNHCSLTDFGIARGPEATAMTQTGNLLGTIDYMAPELFEVDGKADARSDLYALGVLLFEMVTGTLPFSGESQYAVASMHMSKQPPLPSSVVPGLSSQVEQVMLQALEKQPDLRYGSANELAKAFRLAVSGRLQEEAKSSGPLVLSGAAAAGYNDQTYAHNFQDNHTMQQAASHQVYPPQAGALPSHSPVSSRRTRIIAAIALVALLAVMVSVAYAVVSNQPQQSTIPRPGATGTTSNTTTKGAVTPNPTATASAVANSSTATAPTQVSAAAVTSAPNPLVAGQQATMIYNGPLAAGASGITMHWGYNNWNSITDTTMSKQSNGTWQATIPVPSGATQLNMAFVNQSGTWDNNSTNNYNLSTS